jgi:hypothetical protein
LPLNLTSVCTTTSWGTCGKTFLITVIWITYSWEKEKRTKKLKSKGIMKKWKKIGKE